MLLSLTQPQTGRGRVRYAIRFIIFTLLCTVGGFAGSLAVAAATQAVPILGGEFSVFSAAPPPTSARQFMFSLPDSALLTNFPPFLTDAPIGLVTNLNDPANPVYFSFVEGVWERPAPGTPAMERDCPQPDGPPIHATGQGGAALAVNGFMLVRMQPSLTDELANRILPTIGNEPAISSYTFSPVTLPFIITNGSFAGTKVTLKGVMAYGSGEDPSDTPGYDENWTGELFLALDWGTDPLGFKEYALIQCALSAGTTTDDADCLPLTDVAPMFLGSASAASYFSSVWEGLLTQVANGGMYFQGPIPDLLFLYDFSGANSVLPAQTLPPGTLDLSTVFPPPDFGATRSYNYTNANKFIDQYDAGVAFSLPKRFTPPNPVPPPNGTSPGGNACGPTSVGMALYAQGLSTVDARSVYDNTTTSGLAAGNNNDNPMDYYRATVWLGGKSTYANHYTFSAPSPLPAGAMVSYRYAEGSSPTTPAITACWSDINALLDAKQPIAFRTDLTFLTNGPGGGHVILLLGRGHNDDLKTLYGGGVSGDYYVVADPAGHYFANTNGTRYGTVGNLRFVDAGINYGGWFGMYPKELLARHIYDKANHNYRITAMTIGTPFHKSTLRIVVHSPLTVTLTDPLGRQAGLWSDGSVQLGIPGSFYSPAVLDEEEEGVSSFDPDGPKQLEMEDPFDGVYRVDLVATNSGSFILEWSASDTNGVALDSQTFSGTVTNGQHLSYAFDVKLGGPPSLQYLVSHSGVALFWPTNATGFGLQVTTNLANPYSWVSNTTPVSTFNGMYALTNAFSGPSLFFRLKE